MEQQLYAVFGGYSEYLAAPYQKVQRHRLVLIAKNTVRRENEAKGIVVEEDE